MTERIDLDELRKLADAATPGPWYAGDAWVFTKPIYSDDKRLSDVLGMKFEDEDRASAEHARGLRNAEFIAAARTAVPELLARLEAAEREADDLSSRLTLFLDEVTGSRLTYSTYPVETMIRETNARYERLAAEDLAEAEARAEAAEAKLADRDEQIGRLEQGVKDFMRALDTAVDERDAALAKLAAVEALHQRLDTQSQYPMPPDWKPMKLQVCSHCKRPGAGDALHPWPCPTVRALGLPVEEEN